MAFMQAELDLLRTKKPLLYINPHKAPACPTVLDLSIADVHDAEARLQRFAPLLEQLFPELKPSSGIIESELLSIPSMWDYLKNQDSHLSGSLLLKADHSLPVAGSIKARGGIYEVLCIAEQLALKHEVLQGTQDDYTKLKSDQAKEIFKKYTISVGSTGNLGLSVGIMSSALGFQAHVHMSVEAKQWKKERLRKNGVHVVEHKNDYSAAVEQGRLEASKDPFTFFIDDENSKHLFLGYSVAALRLKTQLEKQNIHVSSESPLFVYIPCGVGGAPGGVTFGLNMVFQDNVHCFFAEPDDSPCVLLMMMTERPMSVYEIGLKNKTEADGLAVATASKLVCGYMKTILSGCFTIQDDQLFKYLYHLKQTQNIEIEPSAAAGFLGPSYLLNSDSGKEYLNKHKITENQIVKSNHIVWTTGGLFVPQEEYQIFLQKGKDLVSNQK